MKPILVRPQPSMGPGPTPRDLIEAPLRRPLWVIIPFVLMVGGAVAAGYLAPKRYQSSTLILVESDKMPDSFVQPVTTDTARQRLYTLKQEVLSRTRLEKVIAELDPYPDFRGQPITWVVERMRGAITVNVLDNDAFKVTYVHTDPTTAMKVTNRLAGLFIEEAAQSREAQSEDAYSFIEEQLQSARKDLEKQEWAVREYKQKHMGVLPEQLQTNLATLQRLQLEQQTMAQNVRAAQERVNLLESLPAGTATVDPGAELTQLRAQLNVLRGRYTDEHPDVLAVKARIAAMESGVGAAPPREGRASTGPLSALAQARQEVETLKARRDDLERRLAEFQARVEQVPRTEQELSTLTRDFQKLNENYLGLLKKKLDARMAGELEKRWQRDHFKVLDPAHLPERPVYPNKLLFLALGVVGGLTLGLGAAVGLEFLDASIRHVGELEAVIPYPVIATLPHIVPAALGRPARRLSA